MNPEIHAEGAVTAIALPSTAETRALAVMDDTRNRSTRIMRGVIGGTAFAVTMLAICAAAQVGGEKDDRAAEAVKRGLAYLASRQDDAGSFGRDNLKVSVGITSIAGLALMGDRAHEGAVGRAVKFVLEGQRPDGYFPAQKGSMYDHGFATILIAEALRKGIAPDAREPLTKAVAVIRKSQGTEGGWRYQPQPVDGDSSVTSCQIMALVAARNAGVDVSADVITKAIAYLKKCQNPDGGFRYLLGGGGGDSAFPRSAAALAATTAAIGIADRESRPDVTSAMQFVTQLDPKAEGAKGTGFFFHGSYYAEQALRGAASDVAKRWREGIREHLLGSQRADGSWADKMSDELVTSQACLILQAGRTVPTKGAR